MNIVEYKEFASAIKDLGLTSRFLGEQVRGGTEVDDVDGLVVYKNAFVIKRDSKRGLILTLPEGNSRREYAVISLLDSISLIKRHYLK